jgi:hypothetical protein
LRNAKYKIKNAKLIFNFSNAPNDSNAPEKKENNKHKY